MSLRREFSVAQAYSQVEPGSVKEFLRSSPGKVLGHREDTDTVTNTSKPNSQKATGFLH